MNTEDKLKLIGKCQKLVPLGAMELADDLEKTIDKFLAGKVDRLEKDCVPKNDLKQLMNAVLDKKMDQYYSQHPFVLGIAFLISELSREFNLDKIR